MESQRLVPGGLITTTQPVNAVYSEAATSMSSTFDKNPKSQLIEFFQKREGAPKFETDTVNHSPQASCFKCTLTCPPISLRGGKQRNIPQMTFEGTYRSKKRAEQEAAMAALQYFASHGLLAQPARSTTSTAESMTSPPPPLSSPPQSIVVANVPAARTNGYGNVYVTHPPHVAEVTAPFLALTAYPQALPEPGNYYGNNFEVNSSNDALTHTYDGGANYELDNSDIDVRRNEVMCCTDIRKLQDMALRCLEEVEDIRQELLFARRDLEDIGKSAKQISEASRAILDKIDACES